VEIALVLRKPGALPENTERRSAELYCLCYGCSSYIYYGASCQGGERGSERIKRKQQLYEADSVSGH